MPPAPEPAGRRHGPFTSRRSRQQALTFCLGTGRYVRSCSVLWRDVHEHVRSSGRATLANLTERGAMERQRSSKPVISGPANDATAQAGGPSRREVLRGAGAGLGVAALAPVVGMAGAGQAQARMTARAEGTRSVDFGQDWKFALVNA